MFAILAIGEDVPNISFFASIHEKKQSAKQTITAPTDNEENEPTIQGLIVDPDYPASPEPSVTPHLKTKEQDRVHSELLEIVDDMCVQLNPSYNSGVHTFYSPV